MTATWELQRGAMPLDGESTSVRFSVWAPRAQSVSVRIVEPIARPTRPLEQLEPGIFAGVCDNLPAGARYLYELDSRNAYPDPVSRYQPHGVSGPSQVVNPEKFRWTDTEWRGRELADLVFYELHIGTFSPQGTFEGVIERLDDLKKLGINAIQLMPVAEFPGNRNWGYDGVFPYAVHSAYGGPDGLKRLVDAAHARALAVFMDVVYNHLGPEGNVLLQYGPYFTDRYKTPWGDAINYDGPESDEVRRYFVDNALYWLREYHIDGLRLDAVHAICDFGAYHILAEMKDAARELEQQLNRRLLVVAESDLNDPRIVRDARLGGYGLDGQWSDDFHHAVHSAMTGESQGYYKDFSGLPSVAKAIRDRYVVDGTYSPYRQRRHGASAANLSADRFVTFIQNHDQVGNRAAGDRLSTLVSFEQQKLAAFMSLMSPYVPLLFMGEEYGETRPFLYFVSHGDPQLVEAVRHGRKREFAAFGWSDQVPDPQSPDTFERCRLDPEKAKQQPHRFLLHLYKDLIQLKRTEPLLHPGAAHVDSIGGSDWLTWRFDDPGSHPGLVACVNLSDETRELGIAISGTSTRTVVLSTSDARYGGNGRELIFSPGPARDQADRVQIPAETAVLLRSST